VDGAWEWDVDVRGGGRQVSARPLSGQAGRSPRSATTPSTYPEWGASLTERRRAAGGGGQGPAPYEVRFLRQSHNFVPKRGGFTY
jgi:hypothetical protein